jgi:SSS family solute:Na+ symporter
MSALIVFVVAYMAVTITIGLVAARRVHSSRDYMIAGRSLPLYMNVATVFATWFGAETVLSVSATFAKDGLSGIPGDPFGASVCLVLAALLFARLFYRMNLLTIGDFYKQRYGKGVEVITSLAIVASYLGWTSAQMTALGLVIYVLSGGALALNHAILIGAGIVLVYTIFGGMWSVAFTDLFQTIVILVGLTLVAILVVRLGRRRDQGHIAGRCRRQAQLLPIRQRGLVGDGWRLLRLCLRLDSPAGRIPAHDQRQGRENGSSRHRHRGVDLFLLRFRADFHRLRGTGYGSVPGQAVCLRRRAREIQRVLPDLVLGKMPLWAQVMFFGALLSAILSTASGALLAPTSLFTENVLRPFVPHMSDRQFLPHAAHHPRHFHRLCVVVCAQQHQHHVPDGPERVQRDAGRCFCATGGRGLLEACHHSRRIVLGGRRSLDLAGCAERGSRCNGALPNLIGLFASIILMFAGSLAPQVIRNQGHPIPKG